MSGSGPDNEKPRAWQRMLSGRRLDLLAPSPDDIAIEDIAHGLARVARWNGQTYGEQRLLSRRAHGPRRDDRRHPQSRMGEGVAARGAPA